jgi:hypothetical protein
VDDDDPLMMVVAWKLNCGTMWEISRQEWMDGFSLYGCHTLKQVSEKAQQWKRDVRADDDEFQSFYFFVFNYLRGQKKILEMDSVELVRPVSSYPGIMMLMGMVMVMVPRYGTCCSSREGGACTGGGWNS